MKQSITRFFVVFQLNTNSIICSILEEFYFFTNYLT